MQHMQKELTYLDQNGNTVFTSQFLRNKGTCCKSGCLHCPYGYTVKKNGLQFREVLEEDFPLVETIMKEAGQTVADWKSFWPENMRFLLLKNHVCGVFFKNHIVIKHLCLRTHFQSQDLSKELVESYFF